MDEESTDKQEASGKYLSDLALKETQNENITEELSKSIEFIGKVINALDDPVFVKDEKHRWIVLNDAACTMIGLPRQELIGKSDYDLFPKEQADIFWEKDNLVFKTGQPNINEEVITWHDRKLHTIWTKKSLLRDPQSGEKFIVGIIRDISDKKHSEKVLRKAHDELELRVAERTKELNSINDKLRSEMHLHLQKDEVMKAEHSFRSSIIKYAAEGLCVCHDISLFPFVWFTIWNDRMTEITGYTIEEINRLGWYQTVYPDPVIQEKAKERMARMRQGDNLHREAWEITRKDGKNRIVYITTSVLETADGITHVLALIDDITEQKRGEEALRKSEERFRSLTENTSDWIWEVDRSGVYTYASPKIKDLLGYLPEEVIGKTPFDFMPPEEASRLSNIFQETAKSRSPIKALVNTNIHKNGHEVIIETSAVPILDREGNLTGYRGIDRDITERKRAEDALKFKEHLLDAATDSIFVHDRTGNFIYVNEAAYKTRGYGREELMVLNLSRLETPESVPLLDLRMSALMEKGELIFETTHRKKDGAVMPVEAHARVITTGGEGLVISVLRDITERKQRERELEAIASVATAMRTALTYADVVPVFLDKIQELLGTEGTLLALKEQYSDTIKVLSALGLWSSLTGAIITDEKHICRYVITHSSPYLNNQIEQEPELFGKDIFDDLSAIACVPLIAHGQTIGALLVGRKSDIADYDVDLLTAICDIVANAIHRALLYEQTRRQLHRLSALHTIDMAITSSLDHRITLNILLDQVTTQLQADAAAVLLLNPYEQILEYAAGRGFRSAHIQKTRLKVGEGHAGRAAFERKIVSVSNIEKSNDPCMRSPLLAGEVFIAHHATPLIAKGQVKGVLEIFHREQLIPDPEWLDFFESLAAQAAIAIDNAELFNNLQHTNTELILAYDATIEGWSRALDFRDKETEGHSQRVAELTVKVARAMDMSDAEIVHVRRGALLHDIGKLGVPDSILLKPDALTDEEWNIMKKHPQIAYDILSPIAYLKPALDIPYYHHERWDGTGYPHGLREEQIPLAARIFAVIDLWDALRSGRPYRSSWQKEKAKEYLQEQAGKQFDPKIVEVFLKLTE